MRKLEAYDLIGEIVQLRFILNEANLYSFRFSVPLTPGDAALLAANWHWGVAVEVGVPEPGLAVTLIACFLSAIIFWPRFSSTDNR